jgi:GNAT superfamily N-acetyltransferase
MVKGGWILLAGTSLTARPAPRTVGPDTGGIVGDVDEVRLRDGTRLVVRPIRPVDAPALVALHARLSAGTIYRRYFGARPHLSPADVERFTRVAEAWRFALVAVRETGDLVAVARYEGSPDEHSAEIAVVVDDALQHQGVGRVLLERLVDVARERGVETLVAEVLSANSPMLGLLRAIGLPGRTRRDGEVHTALMDLTLLDVPAPRRERAQRHLAGAGAGARAGDAVPAAAPGEERGREPAVVRRQGGGRP